MGQGRDPHGHAFALLGLGRAGGGETDADHFVNRCEEAEFVETLEVSEEEDGEDEDRFINKLTKSASIIVEEKVEKLS